MESSLKKMDPIAFFLGSLLVNQSFLLPFQQSKWLRKAIERIVTLRSLLCPAVNLQQIKQLDVLLPSDWFWLLIKGILQCSQLLFVLPVGSFVIEHIMFVHNLVARNDYSSDSSFSPRNVLVPCLVFGG